MAYSVPNVLLRMHGAFGYAANDIKWSTGLRLPASTLPDEAEILSFLTALATPAGALHSGMLAGSSCYLTKLTGALVGTSGKYHFGALAPTIEYVLPSPVASTGSNANPWATATVITLRTDLLRGRASHGRMYWPAMGTPIQGSSGLIDAANCDTMATAAKAFITAANTAGGAIGIGPVSVMSFVGTGTTSTVKRVGVGRVPDHQERRENKLQENHVYKTI